MHRTGTSLTARILNLLGVDLGRQSGLLLTKSEENPKGFWEQVAIKEFNDELLGALGGAWDAPPDLEQGWEYDPSLAEYRERAQQLIVDQYGDAELWGWKDPRSAILLPFWQQIVPDLSYVICLRHPHAVAESMTRRRNKIDAAVAHELWLRYTMDALLHTRQGRRVMVFFEDFFEDLDRQVHHLAAFLDQDSMTIEPGVRSTIRGLADPILWRNRTSPYDDAGLPAAVRALWVGLRSAVAPTDQPASRAFSLRDTEASARALGRASARRAEGHKALQKERAEQLRAAEKQLRGALRKVGEYGEKLRETQAKLQTAEGRLAASEEAGRASQVRLRATERGLRAASGGLHRANEKLKQVERSRSWKITRPLRGTTALLARLRGRRRRKRSEQAAQGRDEPVGSGGASRPAATNGAPGGIMAVHPPRQTATATLLWRARAAGDASPGRRPSPLGSTFGHRLLEVTRHHTPTGLMDALGRAESDGASARVRLADHGSLPLVTVIMPTHDRAAIIGDAIRTVIEQEYESWELLVCDDGSTDNTAAVVDGFGDPRLRYLRLPKQGAAAARNAGLREARGEIIAYLDSDNYWHPAFLTTIVAALVENSGRSAAYTDYIDYYVNRAGVCKVRAFEGPSFSQERLLEKPYIDLSAFAHRRELYDCFGGFDERLTRRQDHQLLIKYTWLRDPLKIRSPLMLYQRNDALTQVTRLHRGDDSCIRIIDESVVAYQRDGVRVVGPRAVEKVTVLAWDLSRNHFAKPFAVAEALSADYDVQLISFRFFEEEIFAPLAGVEPRFETVYLPGSDFPDFFEAMARGVAAIRGDAVYVVKPRLPSLGVALLANEQTGVPIVLEVNDLETVVSSPRVSDEHRDAALETLDPRDDALRSAYSDQWSQIMAPLAGRCRCSSRTIESSMGYSTTGASICET